MLLTNWHHRAYEITDYYLILKDFERPFYYFMGRELSLKTRPHIDRSLNYLVG